MAMFVVLCWSLFFPGLERSLPWTVNSVLGAYVWKFQVFFEMIPSRGWRLLDVRSLLNVCPSPVSLVALLQFGNPGMPSFLGDFFGAGCFMFDFKGLLWSFMACWTRRFRVWRCPLCVALPNLLSASP